MKYSACGAAELVHHTRNVPYTHKGEIISILDVTGDFCPTCAEVSLVDDKGQRFGAMVREINKQSNAAFVASEFILPG